MANDSIGKKADKLIGFRSPFYTNLGGVCVMIIVTSINQCFQYNHLLVSRYYTDKKLVTNVFSGVHIEYN